MLPDSGGIYTARISPCFAGAACVQGVHVYDDYGPFVARGEPVKLVLSADACRHLLRRPLRGLGHPLRPLHLRFRLHFAAVVLEILCFGEQRKKKQMFDRRRTRFSPQPTYVCYDAVAAIDTSGQQIIISSTKT